MPVERLIGPIMADVQGLSLTAEDRELLCHPSVGGVILFARNYTDPEQIQALCAEIAGLRTPRLLIAVDHEGGRVQRFRVGFSRLPAMRTLGFRYDESPEAALAEAAEIGATIGRELSAIGVDLCFAPVLDLDHGVSGVIGDRALAEDADVVISLARSVCSGLRSAGLAATGKHFPGHGGVVADSHHELPIDRRRQSELLGDLRPFQALLADGIESLMMAHVHYPAVDAAPASLSRRWIRGYLRGTLRYNGAVFCDDLSMGGAAVAGSLHDRAMLALEAGCDMLPVCNDRPGLGALLGELRALPNALGTARLARLYRRVVAEGATHSPLVCNPGFDG